MRGKELIHFLLRPRLLKNQYRGNSIQVSREDFYPRHTKEVVPAESISGARNVNELVRAKNGATVFSSLNRKECQST